jgi:FkbM family methyltransferase
MNFLSKLLIVKITTILSAYSEPTALKAEKYGYGKECNAQQLEKIIAANVMKNSNCPSRSNWLQVVLQQSLLKPNATIMMIGCNKGDDFVSLMEAWSGNSTYDVDKYISIMKKDYTKMNFQKYRCAIAKHEILKNQPLRLATGYCIEPMPANLKLLHNIMTKMSFDKNFIKILPLAVDIFNGKSLFRNSTQAGKQDLGLSQTFWGEMTTVKVTNIDSLMISENVSHIDFLSIDTEGYDGRVILGMLKSLALNKIRVFEFEYHKIGPWGKMDLSIIIDMLDVLNMDCFWQGNHDELWRLTGCFHQSFVTEKRWSNIVCVNREAEKLIHSIFVNISHQFM